MVIQALRDNMPKWITAIVLALIIGPFALWGINSYFTASSDNSVATVNGDEISPADFERAYQGQYQRLLQFYGASFRPGMIDEKQLRQQVLDNLINETLLDQQVGVKLKDLEQAGLAEDTIVFYNSDNGGVLPRSKRFLQASGTHVPLIMYFPPKWRHLAPAPPGSRISDPIS
ncbi:MAG: SurA N-terminal domain-containing protein, partial [Gammaproteobacteria bacterium]